MKVRIAYLDEPPFYWTGPDGSATGADIELADVVLRAIGVTSIEHHKTSFEELLPGVQDGRWEMNVPIFATPERAQRVAFSIPVWTIGDGFVVQRGNPKALTSYEAVAARTDARVGVIPAQVQYHAARSAGVSDAQQEQHPPAGRREPRAATLSRLGRSPCAHGEVRFHVGRDRRRTARR